MVRWFPELDENEMSGGDETTLNHD